MGFLDRLEKDYGEFCSENPRTNKVLVMFFKFFVTCFVGLFFIIVFGLAKSELWRTLYVYDLNVSELELLVNVSDWSINASSFL